MDKDKKKLNQQNDDDNVGMTCTPTNDMENYERVKNYSKIGKDGTTVNVGVDQKRKNDPKLENTATDVYYKTQCKIPESEVAVPTYDAVVEAKEWVDDENKM